MVDLEIASVARRWHKRPRNDVYFFLRKMKKREIIVIARSEPLKAMSDEATP
jgi:hypothetical protein